jgi:transcriptional regulator with XRE-family HTH domain
MARRSGILGDQRAELKNILTKDEGRLSPLTEKLKLARREAGLTQMTAARMMGRSQSWLKKAEADGRVSFVHLERLALIYWKPLSHFTTIEHEEVWDDDVYLGFSEFRWQQKAKVAAARALLRGIIGIPNNLTKSQQYLKEHPTHPWRRRVPDNEPWPDE